MKPNFYIFVACFSIAAAVIQTQYVGYSSLYSEDLSAKRMMMHEAMKGGKSAEFFNSIGSGRVEIRRLSFEITSFATRLSSMDVLDAYAAVDCLFIALLLFFSGCFFREFCTEHVSTIGVMLIATAIPMTYHFHYYHPWDRLGSLLWLLTAWAILKDRPVIAGVIILCGITNKYDIIAASGLYFLTYFKPTRYVKTTVVTSIIGLLGFTELAFLRSMYPSSKSVDLNWSLAQHLKIEFQEMIWHRYDHPILYAVLPITVLGIIALAHHKPNESLVQFRFQFVSFLYGLFLICYISASYSLIEFRAQFSFWILMIPLPLLALQRIQAESIEI